ncbi:acyltransferase family protein [Sphingobium sp. AN558]|uniref:acyltransferase family protein n=1 Tax=Sphingobium sp. AN558 TaxID=3133442 RepID=UPI0030BF6F62
MENRGTSTAPDQGADSRLEWIDTARGIGIIAVVIGHVWTQGALRDAVYSFHMPLFFLLSGILSKPQPVGAFTRRQLTGQLRPYAAFLLLLILADLVIEPLKGGRPIFHRWPDDLLPILIGGSWLRGPYTIFWFVPCLMAARILFNIALARWPDPRDRRWGLAILPLLALAYLAGRATDISPLGLLTVPMAIVLLWAGAASRDIAWRPWTITLLGALALAGLTRFFPTLNMKVGDYGWPLLSIGSAIATSLLVFGLAKRIAPMASPLAAIGRASLVIMYCHVALIHYLSPYIDKPWLLAVALLAPFAFYHLIRLTPLKRLFL